MANSVKSLRVYAVLFVIIGVTFAIGLNILSDVEGSMNLPQDVENETFNVTSTPENITLSKSSDGLFVEVQSVTCFDTVAQDVEATCTNYGDGTVQITGEEDIDVNESIDYTWLQEDEDARKGANSAIDSILTFTEWLGLIALIIVAGIIIRHVTGFGKAASGGRRGKA